MQRAERCTDESSGPSVGDGERIRVRGAQEGAAGAWVMAWWASDRRERSGVVGLARGVGIWGRRLPRRAGWGGGGGRAAMWEATDGEAERAVEAEEG